MKADLHIHTKYSNDGWSKPEKVVPPILNVLIFIRFPPFFR